MWEIEILDGRCPPCPSPPFPVVGSGQVTPLQQSGTIEFRSDGAGGTAGQPTWYVLSFHSTRRNGPLTHCHYPDFFPASVPSRCNGPVADFGEQLPCCNSVVFLVVCHYACTRQIPDSSRQAPAGSPHSGVISHSADIHTTFSA
jgi:hypothetical protein